MTQTHQQPSSANNPAIEQWEYCFQTVKYEDLAAFMAATVNEMGRQGWEMVTAAPISRPNKMIGSYVGGYTTRFEILFKRRLPPGGRP